MMKNQKILKKTIRIAAVSVAGLVAVATIFVIILNYTLGTIIEKSAPVVGPAVLGTPLAVSNANTRILSGRVALSGIVVGPPEGFDANVFEMSDFKVSLDVRSLVGATNEPIVIHEILIDGPFVSYELKGLNDNLHALLANLGTDAGNEDKPEITAAEKGGRKVCIEHFLFDNAKIRVAVAGGKGVVVPLPKIELTDIGTKSGGATAIEAVGEILTSIATGTAKAVAGVVMDVGGAAVDAASAVGGAAVDAASAVGGAAADAAKGAISAIGGLFGDSGETQTSSDESKSAE